MRKAKWNKTRKLKHNTLFQFAIISELFLPKLSRVDKLMQNISISMRQHFPAESSYWKDWPVPTIAFLFYPWQPLTRVLLTWSREELVSINFTAMQHGQSCMPVSRRSTHMMWQNTRPAFAVAHSFRLLDGHGWKQAAPAWTPEKAVLVTQRRMKSVHLRSASCKGNRALWSLAHFFHFPRKAIKILQTVLVKWAFSERNCSFHRAAQSLQRLVMATAGSR